MGNRQLLASQSPKISPARMSDFLDNLVQAVLSHEAPLQRQMIVLPSRRSITFFRARLAQQLDQAVFSPRILTMEDLTREASGLNSLDPVSTGLELYAAYHELYPGDESYEQFEPWIGAILRDFNTIDTYLIDAQVLYRDLSEIKDINDWSFQLELEEQGEIQKEFNDFWQRLAPLYAAFNARCAKLGLAYSGAIARAAVTAMQREGALSDYAHIHVAGFNALTAAEVAMLDQLAAQDRLTVHWDDAPFFTDNEADPAGIFMRRWKKKKNWNQRFSVSSSQLPEIIMAGHPHAVSQADWAGAVLSSLDGAYGSTALVLADESLLTPVLDRFPTSGSGINITIGVPYRQHGIFHLVTAYFAMHIKAEEQARNGAPAKFYHQDIVQWLELAVRYGVCEAGMLRKLKSELTKRALIWCSPEQLGTIIGAEAIEDYQLAASSSAQVIEGAIAQLGAIKTSEVLDQGVAERIAQGLADSEKVLGRYSFINSALSCWKCISGGLSRERINFVGEPLQGLQVMGLLETRALHFDRVILLGVNEGTLPKSRSYETFIPFEVRKRYGLPTQVEEDAVFAYYFYRLLHGASEAHIAYNTERDELGGGEQSRYLSQIMQGLPQEQGWSVKVQQQLFGPKSSPVPETSVVIPKDEAVLARIKAFFLRGVSFSRLSEYDRCPLDFYYRTIQRLGEETVIEEGIGANELGNVVHAVLEKSFEPQVGKGSIAVQHIERMAKSYPACLQAELNAQGLSERTESGEGALVKEVADHMLKNFFSRERKRISNTSYQVEALETNEKWETQVDIGGKPTTVLFTAKIDKVERDDKGLLLIDYKTGRIDYNKVKLKEITAEQVFDPKNSKAFQLLYYTWFCWRSQKEIARSGIVSLVGQKADPYLLYIKDRSIDEELLGEFEALLYAHLDEIATVGEFTHDDENGLYCNHCISRALATW